MGMTAAETVEEIMSAENVPAKTRLSAAQLTLGIIGISPVSRSESVSFSATVSGDTLEGIRARLQEEARAHALRVSSTVIPALDTAPVSEAALLREASVDTPALTKEEVEENARKVTQATPVLRRVDEQVRDASTREIYDSLIREEDERYGEEMEG